MRTKDISALKTTAALSEPPPNPTVERVSINYQNKKHDQSLPHTLIKRHLCKMLLYNYNMHYSAASINKYKCSHKCEVSYPWNSEIVSYGNEQKA